MTKKDLGFTLIEILIVMSTIAVMSVSMISVLNPAKQVDKAKDAKKNSELLREKITLEEYFNDKDCYPKTIDLSSNFESGSYVYVTDGSDCPRWYVIFSNLKSYISKENACNIVPNCLPANYVSSWSCKTSENYDCQTVNTTVLPNVNSKEPINIGNTLFGGSTMPTITPTIYIGQTYPTITPTIFIGGTSVVITPTPATQHQVNGNDGTWCDDSDNGSYYVQNAYCTDNSGLHLDYCDGTNAKENYCTYIWDGITRTNVHCELGGFYCPNSCSQGACTAGVGISGLPTSVQIGSTGNMLGSTSIWNWLKTIF